MAAVQEIDEWMLDLAKPQNFDDGHPENVLTVARRNFGQLCAALADAGFARAGELSVFDFNSAADHLLDKHAAAAGDKPTDF